MGTLVIIMIILIAEFCRGFYVKMKYPYEGRHHLNKVACVPKTYHPEDAFNWTENVKDRVYWDARMQRYQSLSWLYLPTIEFNEYVEAKHQRDLEVALSDYRWMDYDTTHWPTAWIGERPVCQRELDGNTNERELVSA